MEPLWNYTDRGKLKNSEDNLSQCHFTYHKSQMDFVSMNLALRGVTA
jgi:hypothetical protein